MPEQPSQTAWNGYMQPEDRTTDQTSMAFTIQRITSRIATAAVVKVLAVANSGGVEPVGFVDVQPMVGQQDGAGNVTHHEQINNLPYFRLQGGADAIILDPKVGDIGVAVFCSRDTSAVKKTKKISPPGSWRTHDWADGLYMGGFLNGTPSQYVRFSSDGIEILSPTKVRIVAPTVEVQGDVHVSGAVLAGYGTGDQVGLQTHRHGGVQNGLGNTNAPTAGT